MPEAAEYGPRPGRGLRGHLPGHLDDAGYSGPAEVLVGARAVPVLVELRGFFQPIDGLFHWYGRIAANPELDRLVSANRASVVLRTPDGERPAELSDLDFWGRYRVTGESTPPFRMDLDVPEPARRH